MSNKHREKLQSNLIYSPLTEVITPDSETTERVSNRKPIYFDPNILCCPFCGNKNVLVISKCELKTWKKK
jgi:hypothetical protein